MQLTEFKKLTKLAQRQELLRINTEFKARVKTSGTKFLNEQEYEEALKAIA
jgi:predicted SprT family Zn-dependent metalloprotease